MFASRPTTPPALAVFGRALWLRFSAVFSPHAVAVSSRALHRRCGRVFLVVVYFFLDHNAATHDRPYGAIRPLEMATYEVPSPETHWRWPLKMATSGHWTCRHPATWSIEVPLWLGSFLPLEEREMCSRKYGDIP